MTSSTRPPAAQATELFAAALRGEPCLVVGMGGEAYPVPVRRWTGSATIGDRIVLSHCVGDTVDLGCGPGRMAGSLAERGRLVLGVDLSAEAVRLARSRGVGAIQRDILGPLPRESRWGTALLADGNIGIGGNPSRLLSRVRGLIRPGGLVVVDLAPPGTGLGRHTVRLSVGGRSSHAFPWALLGTDAVHTVAVEAGLCVLGTHEWDGRWFAVLQRGSETQPCAR